MAKQPTATVDKPAPVAVPMVKDDNTGLMMVEATGLVPCDILIDEAGFGLRKGEIRGLSPSIAKNMIKADQAKAVNQK